MRIRQSKYKELIYDTICGRNMHFTTDEVFNKVKKIDDSIGIATVYRQLNALVNENRIQRINDKEKGYIYDGNAILHHHFHCIICGEYTDVLLGYDTALDKAIELETGAVVTSHQMIFEGICKHCKSKM